MQQMTSFKQVQQLLCDLLCEAEKTVEGAVQISDAVKQQALFDLHSGSQACGYVDSVCDLSAAEGLVLDSAQLVKHLDWSIEKGRVDVFVLRAPRGKEAFTEVISFQEICALKQLHMVKPEFNQVTGQVSHSCVLEPQLTTLFHFVVVSRQGRKPFMDRWEPGRYFGNDEPKIILGDVEFHSKKTTKFSAQWDALKLLNQSETTSVK